MTDDKAKRDTRDRSRVSGEEEYEVALFQLTMPEARELIEKYANDRATLEREARNLGSK
ncbi:MAG: DUF3606 domain-containing protein [Mesorhizobium sp.]|uniref:DUF3606 domain-containing protein n=1 Tax=Mesorhizobium sp. TaxID=1871066 RepID=UPI0011F80507|nr:DUF3606 domain-containing protein [Mesorhizobium sp.]TIO48388.1 MAG: DUF3606 domain-containing protein [Mesorhizobium sp.]TIO56739.1 MAG: DUF3606 domain-containing protein [Mesorhizobium sp.]TJV58390.1 MAG: DUF3606 domain-containing protein [Mesorhizobium sp.]